MDSLPKPMECCVSQPLTCFGFHFMLPPIPPCLEPTKLQNIGVFSVSWASSGHLTDHIVSPSFTATPSRNSQLLFPTRNGPETEDAALGRDKHCDNQELQQQLNLKCAPELGGWGTSLTAPAQSCPPSQLTFHLPHLEHGNKENSEVYQIFPTIGMRSQVPDILGPELNPFPRQNTFLSVLVIAERFNYYEKWNFNSATDDSKKQPGGFNAVLCRSLHPSYPHASFNKCLHWEHLHRAAVWGTFLLATQVLFSL